MPDACDARSSDGSPPSREELDSLAGWSLVRASRVVERELALSAAPFGLTVSQLFALAYLAVEELTRSDLARALAVRPQSTEGLVESLLERGLVTRRGPGGRGRRSTYGTTVDGADLVRRAWPSVRASDPTSSSEIPDAATLRAVARFLTGRPRCTDRTRWLNRCDDTV